MSDETTSPNASMAPLLPPPLGSKGFDEAIRVLSDLAARFESYQGELFGPRGAMTRLEKRLTDLEAKIDERDRKATERDRTTVANQDLVLDAINTFRDDLLTLTSRVNALDRRATEFHRRISATGSALDEVEDRLAALEHRRHADTTPAPPEPSAPEQLSP